MANHADYARNLRMATEPGAIELGYFTPPCYVYPFHMAGGEGWLGAGLAARPGQYNFDRFLYDNANENRCGFTLPLNGERPLPGSRRPRGSARAVAVTAYCSVCVSAFRRVVMLPPAALSMRSAA